MQVENGFEYQDLRSRTRPACSKLIAFIGLLILLFLLPACSQEIDLAKASRTPKPVGALATVAPQEEPGVAISTTPELPEGRSTQISTPQIENPTPTPQPSSTPTAVIPGLIGPDIFSPDVNPLTGLLATDPAILDRRPIAIKLSNSARVRPQAGLNNADLVFEHLTEGGITRFTAIYYSQDASKVGSIRSGRLIDLEIPIMYDAAFAYSGSSAPLRLMFREALFFDRIVSIDFAHGGFERISNPEKPAERVEDTLYTNTYDLRWILDQRGQDSRPEFSSGMAFHTEPPEGGITVTSVEILYPATGVFWSYSTFNDGYLRWSDGVPHLDANSGNQLLFQNVVIIRAPHLDTEIIEDSGGSPSIQIQIWGEGPATIYRNGLRYDGFWRRLDSRHMLTFFDSDGNLLPLSPGRSFFQIVPSEFSDVYESP
jgi:hypothetical protein